MLYRRAYSNLMLGNYNEAHDLFDRLSKTKQYSSAATFFNAYIEYANERYDNAMELFQSVDRVGELGYQSQYYMCQIHIQKIAPGPPMRIAPQAPTIFPVPTCAAIAVASAWNELM